MKLLTLPEALYIVSQNAHGVAHNYWDVYLPAILLVNEAFPVVGYCDEEDESSPEMAQRAWNKEQDYLREQLKG